MTTSIEMVFGEPGEPKHTVVRTNARQTMFYVYAGDIESVGSRWLTIDERFLKLRYAYLAKQYEEFGKLVRKLLTDNPWKPLPKGTPWEEQWVGS